MSLDYDQQDQILHELASLKRLLLEKDKPFLSLNEASAYLGISKHTIYSYTSRGIIPFYKLQGRRLYFSVDDLDRFILNQKNRVSSNEEIEELAATKAVSWRGAQDCE